MANVHIPACNALLLHIPKTAGMSVSRALAEAFPDAEQMPVRGMTRARGAAAYVGARLGRDVFARSFSFCFVRNPWDWTVSGWKHVTRNRDAYGGDGTDFADFVTGRWRAGLRRNPNRLKFATPAIFVAYHTQITQWEHLLLGRIRPQPVPRAFTARFERLEDDWARICERLGRDIALPRINVSPGASYTEYYDDRLREIVARRNAPLIARSATGSESDPRETPMSSLHIAELNAFFLHVPKTAGMSVSTALAEAFPEAPRLPVRGMRRAHGIARHMVRRVGLPPLSQTYSFCFVRNPWDWTVSGWKHVTQNRCAYGETPPDFEEFVTGDWRRGLSYNPHRLKFAGPELFVAYHTKVTQWQHLSLGRFGGQPAPLAFIAQFERLEADWARICERLGRDIPLPRINVSPKSHYTEHYDDKLRAIVAAKNAELIGRFGYRFGA